MLGNKIRVELNSKKTSSRSEPLTRTKLLRNEMHNLVQIYREKNENSPYTLTTPFEKKKLCKLKEPTVAGRSDSERKTKTMIENLEKQQKKSDK